MENLGAARNELLSSTDPFVQSLARKAILQTSVHDFDGVEWPFQTERPTELGVFRVLPTVSDLDWSTVSEGLRLEKGQVYLDYHMPRSDGLTNQIANEGYRSIAEYMESRPEISHIVGVTYRAMALSAKSNQGFEMEQLELPDAVMNFASAFWQNMMPDANPRHFKAAYAVWHTRDSFIERFTTRD